MDRALKIKVNLGNGGVRAGGIDPRDANLRGNPLWQNLDTGYEIRLVLDDRDLSIYDGVEGVEVLEGDTVIDAAVAALKPVENMYRVTSEALMNANIAQANIDLSSLSPEADENEELEFLYNAGISGIKKFTRTPPTVASLRNS